MYRETTFQTYSELKEKKIQEKASLLFKHRGELELFKKSIIQPFNYTCDLPSACISKEQIDFIFKNESEDNSSFSKIKLSPPSIMKILSQQQESQENQSQLSSLMENRLNFLTDNTSLFSFLPPPIHKPFLFPHSPLVPCNSSCDIVHFFVAPSEIYIQVLFFFFFLNV
jgi:hypothetical protein